MWLEYADAGLVVIAVMLQNSSGGEPTQTDLQSWAAEFGLEHPVLADPAGTQDPYVTVGYPTYVVIDRTMKIRNPDLWPFDPDEIIAILNE